MGRRAGIVFIDAFLGSLATLLVSGQFMSLDSDVVPDAVLLLEVLLSGMIAGLVAVIGVVRDWLAEMNGHDDAVQR